MNNKQIATTIIGLAILAGFIIGGVLLKEKRDREAALESDRSQTVTAISEIELVVKTIKEYNQYYAVTAEYPQFKGVAPIFNQTIERVVLDAIASHKTESENNQKYMIAIDVAEGREPRVPEQFELYVQYEQDQMNARYISFVMRIGGYAGGAHGYQNIITFNYDVPNQTIMSLADLFPNDSEYLTTLSQYAREQLRATLGDYTNETFIMDGTNPTVENFKNFTFDENTITLYFPQYQVAPYAAGEQQVQYSLRQ